MNLYLRLYLSLYPVVYINLLFSNGATAPSGPGPPHYRDFTITLRHTTLVRTSPDEWSARSRDLYLTTHNTHKRQTSMPPAGFEPTIPVRERLQTHALYRVVTGFGVYEPIPEIVSKSMWACMWAYNRAYISAHTWACTVTYILADACFYGLACIYFCIPEK
jgi:hypothetical protein